MPAHTENHVSGMRQVRNAIWFTVVDYSSFRIWKTVFQNTNLCATYFCLVLVTSAFTYKNKIIYRACHMAYIIHIFQYIKLSNVYRLIVIRYLIHNLHIHLFLNLDVLIFHSIIWIVHRIGNIQLKSASMTAIAAHDIESTSGFTYHRLEIINQVGP